MAQRLLIELFGIHFEITMFTEVRFRFDSVYRCEKISLKGPFVHQKSSQKSTFFPSSTVHLKLSRFSRWGTDSRKRTTFFMKMEYSGFNLVLPISYVSVSPYLCTNTRFHSLSLSLYSLHHHLANKLKFLVLSGVSPIPPSNFFLHIASHHKRCSFGVPDVDDPQRKFLLICSSSFSTVSGALKILNQYDGRLSIASLISTNRPAIDNLLASRVSSLFFTLSFNGFQNCILFDYAPMMAPR